MLVTVPSACTRCDSGASTPMVAATLEKASSTGIPAAIRAPKASSIRIRVTGTLMLSAEVRSSPTRSSMASSRLTSPTCRTSRVG